MKHLNLNMNLNLTLALSSVDDLLKFVASLDTLGKVVSQSAEIEPGQADIVAEGIEVDADAPKPRNDLVNRISLPEDLSAAMRQVVATYLAIHHYGKDVTTGEICSHWNASPLRRYGTLRSQTFGATAKSVQGRLVNFDKARAAWYMLEAGIREVQKLIAEPSAVQ